MRRNLIHTFQPESHLSGVIASVMQRKRSVQAPVSFVRSLSGLALRLPVSPAETSHTAGATEARNAAGLRTRRTRRSDMASVVSAQVHARVQAGHLIAIAVEHERFPREELADTAFLRLAPARVIDRRVHV